MTQRLVYVCPNSQLGGAEEVLLSLLRNHDRTRYAPETVVFSDGPLLAELRATGAPVHLLTSRPRLRSPLGIARAIREIAGFARGASLVHGVMGYAHLFAGPAARLAGTKSAWFQHGPTGNLDWLTGRVPTDVLFTNSSFTAHEQSRYRAHAALQRVVAPGTRAIDDDALAQSQAAGRKIREQTGVSATAPVFTLLARFSPMKGHPLFVDAAALTAREFPDAHFFIAGDAFLAGDAEYRRTVERQIADSGLARRFSLLGSVRETRDAVIAASTAVVNASRVPEPFGLTLIEAMMRARPAVAPRQGGPLEIIEQDQTGLFFSPGDAASLAEALGAFARDPSLSARLGAAGRTIAQSRFTEARMTRAVEAVYESLW